MPFLPRLRQGVSWHEFMNLKITYSVKFRAFGITFGTVSGSFGDTVPFSKTALRASSRPQRSP